MREDCEYFRSLIEREAEEPLTAEEASALSAHLTHCPDCRAVQSAYASIAATLAEDMRPPVDFADTVMARVRAEEAKPSPRQRKISPRAHALAAAACVVLIAGIGIFTLRQTRMGRSGGAMQYESAAMDMAAPAEGRSTDAAPAAGIPESDVAMGAPAPEPEEAVMDDAMEITADTTADSGTAFTRDNPAYVPEGQEDAFEALLSDARWPEGEPKETWHVIAAVEYHGVIYEFLTDDGESYLLWQDAAEGLPVHSPGTVSALWDILG